MGGIHRFYGILQNPWKNVLGTRPVLVFVNQFVKPDETLDKAMTTAVHSTGAFLVAVPGVNRWVVEHGAKLIWRSYRSILGIADEVTRVNRGSFRKFLIYSITNNVLCTVKDWKINACSSSQPKQLIIIVI
ncbi:hypothetical protein C4D60_Mb09t10480 [Musa balbisiana]|uniref:Uncharacterized protein n=1 Tax=Musa balbisiana TaxID=52838 RepID=A0A4S8IHV5_MUSBA|nr:hypothetical protein C4D60_Mb09t10480 [Musa balbisiana]